MFRILDLVLTNTELRLLCTSGAVAAGGGDSPLLHSRSSTCKFLQHSLRKPMVVSELVWYINPYVRGDKAQSLLFMVWFCVCRGKRMCGRVVS